MKILLTTAFQEDNIHNMDNLASHYNLTIMCLYRKDAPASEVCSRCELYIENYLISTGRNLSLVVRKPVFGVSDLV